MHNTDSVIQENARRLAIVNAPYDPWRGTPGVVPRQPLQVQSLGECLVPSDLLRDYPHYANGVGQDQLMHFTFHRFVYDFEYFCAYCVRVQDKEGAHIVPFVLRAAQRKLIKCFEDQRRANKPIRVILLKARQWGGSTATQIYMAWIQLFHRPNWHSVVCAHLKDAANNIKGMYATLLENFPEWIYGPIKFQPYQRTQNISYIKQTGARITVGSAEAPESVRSQNVLMAHMSEVGLYPETRKNNPSRLFRSVTSSILTKPYTMIVIESTANGTGNWFHTEWLNAERGKSNNIPLFVAWFEIEMYSMPLADTYEEFISAMTDYEWKLWELGATLEAINWYRHKLREYHNHEEMMAEFPSTDIEAFVHSGEIIFSQEHCKLLRRTCREPDVKGEIFSHTNRNTGSQALQELDIIEQHNGCFKIWQRPDTNTPVARRYIVSVDVGGRSAKADYSVITVLDRYWMLEGGVPEVVAEWRGHIDHDLLAWKAAQIATYYNNALLVIESNTIESKDNPDAYTDDFILDQIASSYDNLYARHDPQRIREGLPPRWGFHTNRKTKQTLVDTMIAIVRSQSYIERNDLAIDEMLTYERLPNGAYAATIGHHDDILMTRMIALYVSQDIEPPAIIEHNLHYTSTRRIITEATM
ncbi:MAG: hypothetical protein IIV86_04500 [Bacteroidaceae bacterium]|nr:hypothetical protein [Bacteroidaceae bacterium]